MTHRAGPDEQTTDAPAGRRSRLIAALLPESHVRVGPVEGVAVLVLAALGAFFRLGTASLHGRLWAEDGAIFLQQAVQHGPLHPIGYRYGGYLSVGPRLVTAVLYPLPLRWQGHGMHVAAAVVEGALALLVYVALAGHLPQRLPRALVAGCAVAVPVGPEALGNIANFQWFLMFAALIGLFWTPRGRTGWVAVAVVVLVATTSSPFGGLVFGAALVRWLLTRGRGPAVVLAVGAAGFAVQTLAMVTAPHRTDASALHPALHPGALGAGYLRRVLGDGVLGVSRLSQAQHPSVTVGLVVFVGLVVLGAATWRVAHPGSLTFVGALLLLSVATFAVPVAVSGVPTDLPYYAARYFVTPALFAETALLVLATRAVAGLRDRGADHDRPDRDRPDRGQAVRRFVGAGVATVAVVALLVGLVTSFDESDVYGRDRGPSWASSTKVLQRDCAGRPDATRVTAEVLPIGHYWFVHLTCGQVRARS